MSWVTATQGSLHYNKTVTCQIQCRSHFYSGGSYTIARQTNICDGFMAMSCIAGRFIQEPGCIVFS